MKVRELADHYFASVRARDIDQFIALFADDAVMVMPDGREYRGHSEIRAMELAVFSASPPTPSPVSFVVGDGSVAVEVEVRLASGETMKVANIFHLDDAMRIQRLSVYRKI